MFNTKYKKAMEIIENEIAFAEKMANQFAVLGEWNNNKEWLDRLRALCELRRRINEAIEG